MSLTSNTRSIIKHRSGGLCELCQREPMTNIHHRKPRGMGGTRRPWVDEPSNLIALCGSGTTGCHGWIESHRADSYDRGLLLKTGMMPFHTPFQDDRNEWWLLVGDDKHLILFPNPRSIYSTRGVGLTEDLREETNGNAY